MSRIILTEWPNGQERFVVGWDHPAGGAFWQEFNLEPAEDEEYPEDWEEVSRHGGMWPGIPLKHFRDAVPEDIRPLITDKVMQLLIDHSREPDSGYNLTKINLAKVRTMRCPRCRGEKTTCKPFRGTLFKFVCRGCRWTWTGAGPR